LALFAAGCGDDDPNLGAAVVPAVEVQQSSIRIPGGIAPANPLQNIATPADLNYALGQIYQARGSSDATIQKVLVLMPGFLGGAGNFDYLARRVVTRSRGRTAVWAIDRRSNALEDHTGFDAAETARDPDIAKRYYFGGAEVAGRTFGGFLTGTSVAMASEWGIRVHIEDLDALISEARRRYPQAAIFLGGHSLGASIVPIYAAWDFGAYAGFERISGLILLEGGPNPMPQATPPAQDAYELRGITGGGGRTSLQALRAGNPISGLQPFAGTDIFVTTEIVGMRVSPLFGQPDAISPDTDIIRGFFSLLFGLTEIPAMTNRAALGLGFDGEFEPLSFVRAGIGELVGPSGDNPNLAFFRGLGLVGRDDQLQAPTDPNATYDWRSGRAQMQGHDPTDVETLATILFRGPSNFVEWYFPTRLSFDVGVTNTLNVAPQGDWRREVYGMAATENARVDVPVFAAGGSRGLTPDLARFASYRDSIAPTLRNGSRRDSSPAGFRASIETGHYHLDVLTARDEEAGNGLFGPLVQWMDRAAELAPSRPR